MKKILIPTDFSQNAGDALAYALDFLGDESAKIHIVHSVSPAVIPGDMPAAAADLVKMQMDFAEENMKALEAFGNSDIYDNIIVTTNVMAGPVSPNLKQAAKEFDADLIIMGTRGEAHDRMDKWLGTISTNVIEEAPCPVILIPHGYKYQTIDNVIYSTDINHDDPYELWRAMESIKPHTAIVQCLHVVKANKEEASQRVEEFKTFMESQSPSIKTDFTIEEGDNIEDTIEKFAEDTDAEMIIMHRSKRGFWQKLFGVSHTKRMVSGTRIPLMVVN